MAKPCLHPHCFKQVIQAVEAAWRAGILKQRVELMLPLIGATDLDDWCVDLHSDTHMRSDVVLATPAAFADNLASLLQSCCRSTQISRIRSGMRSRVRAVQLLPVLTALVDTTGLEASASNSKQPSLLWSPSSVASSRWATGASGDSVFALPEWLGHPCIDSGGSLAMASAMHVCTFERRSGQCMPGVTYTSTPDLLHTLWASAYASLSRINACAHPTLSPTNGAWHPSTDFHTPGTDTLRANLHLPSLLFSSTLNPPVACIRGCSFALHSVGLRSDAASSEPLAITADLTLCSAACAQTACLSHAYLNLSSHQTTTWPSPAARWPLPLDSMSIS